MNNRQFILARFGEGATWPWRYFPKHRYCCFGDSPGEVMGRFQGASFNKGKSIASLKKWGWWVDSYETDELGNPIVPF
jgi:hypothetical protein